MHYTLTHHQGKTPAAVIHIADRVNLGNADLLVGAAHEAMTGGAERLVIDMSDIPSITSAGLRALLEIHRLFEQKPAPATDAQGMSRYLVLASPNPHVRQVLQVAGFSAYLHVFDDLPAALAAFS